MDYNLNVNDMNVTYKKRLNVYEAVLMTDEVVKGCFVINKDTKEEEYKPALFDYSMKAAIVRHYSNYADRLKIFLAPYFKNDEEGLAQEIGNAERLYDFCMSNISLEKQDIKNLGIDENQVESIINAAKEELRHEIRIIENCAPVNLLMERFDESVGKLTEGLSGVLSAFNEGLGSADVRSFMDRLAKQAEPEYIVKAYLESDEKKRLDKELEKVRREKDRRAKNYSANKKK